MQEADGALRVSRRLENRPFVVGHCALRCHFERVGLDLHVGRELPLALGAVIANRAIESSSRASLDALAVASRLGHGAGVELSGAVRRSDKGPDDALQMDLHGLLAQAFGEALGSVDHQPFMKAADPIAVDDSCAGRTPPRKNLPAPGATGITRTPPNPCSAEIRREAQ